MFAYEGARYLKVPLKLQQVDGANADPVVELRSAEVPGHLHAECACMMLRVHRVDACQELSESPWTNTSVAHHHKLVLDRELCTRFDQLC